MMRTFLAIALPPGTAKALYRARSVLRESWKGIKWVKPENYHITLVFLGRQEEATLSAVREALPRTLKEFKDFEIELNGTGHFGPVISPRVLVERIGRGRDELIRLQSTIRPTMEALIGWEERRYRPHVTLGRARRRGVSGPPVPNWIPADMEQNIIPAFRAGELILYRSETKPDGAVYTPIEKWKLEERR